MSSDNPFLAQLLCVWTALAVLLVGGVWQLVRSVRAGVDRRWLGTATAVFCAALLARLIISPHTLVHENAHGYEYIRSALSAEGYFYHGSGYYAFMFPLTALFGQRAEVIFWVNALLGAVTALFILQIGQRLLASRSAGLFAALLWCVWPLGLRVGASESMFPLALFAGSLAWFLWLRAWDMGGPGRFVLAGAALALAVQIRPQMALWPGVLLLSLPASPGWSRQLKTAGPWAGAALFGGLIAPWLAFRLEVLGQEGVPGFLALDPLAALAALFSDNNLLFRTDWTPWAILVLGLLGLTCLLRQSPRALPALLGGMLLLAWFSIGVRTGETSSVRLQQPLQIFFLLWAGCGAAWLARQSTRVHRALPTVLGLLLAGLCLLHLPKIREEFNPQQEYAFLAEKLPLLDQRCWIVQADRFMADRIVSTEFPRWMTAAPVVELHAFMADETPFAEAPCAIFYRGVSCYWHKTDEPMADDGLRPECWSWRERFALVPILERSLSPKPDTPFRVIDGPLTIGFYRLEPRRGQPLPRERPAGEKEGFGPEAEAPMP